MVIARRLVQLIVARCGRARPARACTPGWSLLFSLVAVAPAIIVAVFSVVLPAARASRPGSASAISGALDNSLDVAQAYLEEHKEEIRADALAMAADLNREGPA